MSDELEPLCIGCRKTPDELPEYEKGFVWDDDDFDSPDDFVRQEEGTYNSENGHFACTDCYIKMGQPSSAAGWIAP